MREILGEQFDADVTADDLLKTAAEMARKGEYRLAIRRAYLALLYELEQRGKLRWLHLDTRNLAQVLAFAIGIEQAEEFARDPVGDTLRLAGAIAIAIPLIPTVARVIRANTLALRELPFVEAAKSIGMSETRIALRHVLPNTLAPLIVLATAQLGSTILTEASLSFLGLGIPEPYPSWGRMLSESAAEYVRTAPWLVIFPGVAISLAVFGTNLFGDALRDILDPRQRG